jgi:choline monooxygenase
MFVHQHQLRHVLTPQHYHSAQQHRLELERLFLPTWHFVATTADLPRHGDFLTFDLLGQPVQLRNIDGEVHAFQNVCAHRHCLLTSKPKGSDPRFRCQYHGWEYTKEGRTGPIPDAQCFRPFDRENARLRKFRLATCGELIFLSLADDSPTLADYLGPFHAIFSEGFAPPFRQGWRHQADFPVNWKAFVENTLESYHISCLHPKTFKEQPAEDNCWHDLHDRYTSFRSGVVDPAVRRGQGWIAKVLGGPATNLYTHSHIHPNLLFSSLDVHRMIMTVFPTSPTTCRILLRMYPLAGRGRGPLKWLLARLIAWLVNRTSRQILEEDARIFADLQRGLRASCHPGVIGTREERIHVFQNYVIDRCAVLAVERRSTRA